MARSTSSDFDPLSFALQPPSGETDELRAVRLQREAEERLLRDAIDEELRAKRENQKYKRGGQSDVKLLLLGQAESGKPTLQKQFQLLYAPRSLENERAARRPVVYLNIVKSVRTILEARDLDTDDEKPTAASGPASALIPHSALVVGATAAPTALGMQDDWLDPTDSEMQRQPLPMHTAERVAQTVGSASASPDTKEYPGTSQLNLSPRASSFSPLTFLDDMNMKDSQLTLPQRPFLSLYSPPYDMMSRRTEREMEYRGAQIASLKEKIAQHHENLRNMQEKELETLRPIVDNLQGRICAIQHEMARLWTEYTSRMSKAQEYTQQQIAELQKQIESLKQENSNPEPYRSPIRHLPTELLAEILWVVIGHYKQNPFTMMSVGRSWRATVLNMVRVWSRFTIRPWTSQEEIEFVVRRTRQAPLDVVVDLNPSRPSFMHSINARWDYRGLALAATTIPRWRTLTVAAFPSELGVAAAAAEEDGFPVTSSQPLELIEVFKITGSCETSVPFYWLLHTVATTSTEQLTYIMIGTTIALNFLTSPAYRTLFSRLKHLKVDIPGKRYPVDILPYFENLEVFEAYRLHLPTCHHDVDLPIVRTLRRMSIKVVSVQWMSGRTFPSLEDCTIIWPHHPESLRPGGGVDLPVCTQFTYHDHLLEPMLEFRLPKLDKMVVRNEAWNRPKGSTQLASVWGESAIPRWLQPRVLHLDTQCHDQHLINALRLHPDLEELVLGLVRPDGLGKKFFNSMVARRLGGMSSSSVSPSRPVQPNEASSDFLVAPLVPKLKVFGLRYRRWIREQEVDEITPLLEKFIQSREMSEVPLQSVKFWPTKDTPEEEGYELVPLRR